MNLKPYFTKARLAIEIAGLCAVVLFVSWVAGQCRTWKQPKPTPAAIDQGTPVAGPSSSAPTVTESLPIARPDMTRAELETYAKKYGLELAPAGTLKSRQPVTDLQGTKRQQLSASADVSEPVAQTFPLLLAEESFKHAPSGADVDVAAWLPGYGERVDLRASWREWKPPAVAQPKIPVCQSGSFFQNEAKWVKEIGAGYILGGGKAGIGAFGSVAYRGPRTGDVTWGARAFGAFSPESGAVGVGGFSASW